MPRLSIAELRRVWRYYQAGVVNTLFGYGLYALFIQLGLGMYAAQALGHVLGVAFNYLTYSRHVFHDAGPAKTRFIASYAVNYLVSLAALAAIARVVPNPYAAGAIAIVIVSLVNYFVLSRFVFVNPRATG